MRCHWRRWRCRSVVPRRPADVARVDEIRAVRVQLDHEAVVAAAERRLEAPDVVGNAAEVVRPAMKALPATIHLEHQGHAVEKRRVAQHRIDDHRARGVIGIEMKKATRFGTVTTYRPGSPGGGRRSPGRRQGAAGEPRGARRAAAVPRVRRARSGPRLRTPRGSSRGRRRVHHEVVLQAPLVSVERRGRSRDRRSRTRRGHTSGCPAPRRGIAADEVVHPAEQLLSPFGRDVRLAPTSSSRSTAPASTSPPPGAPIEDRARGEARTSTASVAVRNSVCDPPRQKPHRSVGLADVDLNRIGSLP